MARLVAIGDSLTQGFQSLAITHTDLSYPAMIAECMGLHGQQFRRPNFQGAGGLPCSIEWIARRLEDRYGANLEFFEWIGALHRIPELLDEVEDYWERGVGSQSVAHVDYHNLAVWGFEVADSYNISAGMCAEAVQGDRDDLLGIPSNARLRTAYRVLNPSHNPQYSANTQLSIAQRIKEQDGEIDHLIVALGANNCLGTVVELRLNETGDEPPGPNSDFTLWTPQAFEREYDKLVEHVVKIGAKHVYLSTIPHVTIPPITRGVMRDRGRLPEGRKYFDHYTRFFILDKEFAPERDPHLTGEQAAHIDRTIDEYNAIIRRVAEAQGFTVVDMCGLLDELAVRRNHGRAKLLPTALSDLSVRFFEIQPQGQIKQGGLISLDGVHPTACGYSLIAQLFVEAMREHEPGIPDVNYLDIRRCDALVTRPPRTLNDIFGALKTLERYFHLSRWIAKSSSR